MAYPYRQIGTKFVQQDRFGKWNAFDGGYYKDTFDTYQEAIAWLEA